MKITRWQQCQAVHSTCYSNIHTLTHRHRHTHAYTHTKEFKDVRSVTLLISKTALRIHVAEMIPGHWKAGEGAFWPFTMWLLPGFLAGRLHRRRKVYSACIRIPYQREGFCQGVERQWKIVWMHILQYIPYSGIFLDSPWVITPNWAQFPLGTQAGGTLWYW